MYYCESCKKHHPDKWKVHLKYKKVRKPILEVLGEDPVEIEFDEALTMINAGDLANLVKRITNLEKDLNRVLGILIHWKGFIDRKHPYWEVYQPLFDDLEK